jgi:hypothetical protein
MVQLKNAFLADPSLRSQETNLKRQEKKNFLIKCTSNVCFVFFFFKKKKNAKLTKSANTKKKKFPTKSGATGNEIFFYP